MFKLVGNEIIYEQRHGEANESVETQARSERQLWLLVRRVLVAHKREGQQGCRGHLLYQV